MHCRHVRRGNGPANLMPMFFSKNEFEHLLKQFKDLLLVHKRHLQIHLGEFGLAVGPQILVPKAAGYLIVFVNPTHHQKLLENLRGLRQGVELALVHTAGLRGSRARLRGCFL